MSTLIIILIFIGIYLMLNLEHKKSMLEREQWYAYDKRTGKTFKLKDIDEE